METDMQCNDNVSSAGYRKNDKVFLIFFFLHTPLAKV